MTNYIRYLSELIYPELCLHCGDKTMVKNTLSLCFKCELQLEPAWTDGSQNKLLKSRFKGIIQLEYAMAQFYFIQNGVSQSIIHEAKYNGITKILNHFGYVISTKIKEKILFETLPDLIIPVPNNWLKRMKIGYNQAAIYSSEIAANLNINHSTKILKKRHDRTSQTKRNKLQRFEHLSNLYYLKNQDFIVGKHILLIDDVITSGATVETCVNLLMKAGVKKVSVLAFMIVK